MFEGVRAVLEAHGWTRARQEGSHATFTKPGQRSPTVSLSNGKVKRYLVDQVCDRLGLDEA